MVRFSAILCGLVAAASIAAPRRIEVSNEYYRISCGVKDGTTQRGDGVDLIEASLNAELVVTQTKTKKDINTTYSLTNLRSYWFTYSPGSENDVKRPSQRMNNFSFLQAASVGNDPEYQPRKYKGFAQFRLDYVRDIGMDIETAEFKIPTELSGQKEVQGILNLHFDQGHAVGNMKCRVSQFRPE